MSRPLPILVSRLAGRAQLVLAVEAALEDGLAFVPLARAPDFEPLYKLEIRLPDGGAPIYFEAEPAGDPSGDLYPLVLHCLHGQSRDTLRALIAQRQTEPAPALPSERPVADAGASMIGRTLGGGKYRIDALLGAGGMGQVYQAHHLGLDKPVAIKLLHEHYQADPEFAIVFKREALAVSRLDHPNVVRVMDFGQEPDGVLYLVMELLAGYELRALLDRERALPTERIVGIMMQVCAALSASHAQGIVHRDVKPDNIFLVPAQDDEGRPFELVKVCDFGIAADTQEAREGTQMVGGTPDYMSPEQARAAAPEARSDVYSCGVVLYEMAAGRVPFAEVTDPQDIIERHLTAEPPPLLRVNPAVDPRLDTVIRRAMSKDPAHRQQTARELRAELRALVSATPPAGPVSRDLHGPVSRDLEKRGHSLPPSMTMLSRDDAIDVDELLAGGPWNGDLAAGQATEKQSIPGAQLAKALIREPERVLGSLDAIRDPSLYAHEMKALERAAALLAQRGEAEAFWNVVQRLDAHARGAKEGDVSREAVAARTRSALLGQPALLDAIAAVVLDGAPAARDAGRRVLVKAGTPGARALCARGERPGGLVPAARLRFVAAVREIGPPALLAIVETLQRHGGGDAALVEDLLRAVPDPLPALRNGTAMNAGHVIAECLRHPAPSVRRAAVVAIAAVSGARANPMIAAALDDPDDGLRIAAIGALRRTGGINLQVIRRLEPLLLRAPPAGDELRAAVIAALADTTGEARARAIELLAQALKPQAQSFLSKLVAGPAPESSVVLSTMARVLLAIGGPEGRRVVEQRAAHSGADLKRQLLEMLAGRS